MILMRKSYSIGYTINLKAMVQKETDKECAANKARHWTPYNYSRSIFSYDEE